MEVTELPMVAEVSAVLAKAKVPMEVTELGITTEVRLLQSLKA